MREVIVHTRQVYAGRVVKLEVSEVRLPDGSAGVREVVRHQGAVAVVPVFDNRDVLLVRQYRIGAGASILEIPAGLLEAGERPEACAARELQEETGYQPGALTSLGGYYTAPGYTTEYIHLFLAADLTPSELASDPDEFIEVARMPLSRALEMVDAGEIVDGKTQIGLLRAARHLG
ncbi:MAG: NUDIX hydrolase [Aggregatilineales bacterium]